VVVVFIGQVVEIFLDIGILLVAEEVTFIEYGGELVDGIEEEVTEIFFWQEGTFDRTLRAPTEN
jgi:hypothetical protein